MGAESRRFPFPFTSMYAWKLLGVLPQSELEFAFAGVSGNTHLIGPNPVQAHLRLGGEQEVEGTAPWAVPVVTRGQG
jgi:hypothetical protein